jgi:hypothetical protein
VGRLLQGLRRHDGEFNVPEAEHKELFAIVESTKGDIVSPFSPS